ncbi:Hsp20/alpha crystallin family protein [Nitrospira sp. Nam74]
MALASVDVDRLLHDTLRSMNASGWAPSCNAYEDEHGFHIEVALPGVDRQDMNILFEDGVLTVKGERKETGSDNARRYFAQEIGWGGFSRSFRLPTYIDPDKVSASYKDGVLVLGLPKREEAKPRRIEIS